MKLPRSSAGAARVLGAVLGCGLAFPMAGRADVRPIRLQRLSVEEGLSQVTVLAIHQDSRGFMWFGTESGLNRYDGYAVTVYKHAPEDPDSLPNDVVWSVAEDAAGDLWIATENGGIARWDRRADRFVRYPRHPKQPGGLPDGGVRTLIVDGGGMLWIGTRESGLLRFDPRSGSVTAYRHRREDPASLSHDSVFALLPAKDGRLWVGTNGGLNRLDPARGRFERYRHDEADGGSLSDDRVRALFEDGRGDLWVGTFGGGLSRLAGGAGRFQHFSNDPGNPSSLSHSQVRAILEDNKGRLWVGTGDGLSLRDEASGGFVRYRRDPGNPHSLSDNNVMSLYQDRGGILWVGTRAGGVNKWNPATWSFGHQTADPASLAGPDKSYVSAFSVGPAGRLWIGTMGRGLQSWDRARGSSWHYRHDPRDPHSLSDDRVMSLWHDREGTLWAGTLDGGLNRLDLARGRFTVFRHDPRRPGSISANGVMTIMEDSRGALWLGTFRGGLNRFDRRTRTFTAYRHDSADARSLSGDIVTALAEAPDGSLWVGTDGGGLNLFDPASGRSLRLRHDPSDPKSLSADTVFALHVDASGRLWVGTRGGGLLLLESLDRAAGKASFRVYTRKQGLPAEVVYGILPDDSGHVWLSTSNGLSRFDPRRQSFQSYNVTHGLQGTDFNFGACYKSARGELFFGGPDGFNAFFPERLEMNTRPPSVVLTSVLKFNKPVRFPFPTEQLRSLEVRPRDQVVTFEFAALDYAAPEKNQYAYRLDGFDPDWIELGPIRRVTYTNLDPGRYVLRVKAANNDGLWSDGLALPLHVVPPFWRTWWAYLGYLLAASGLAVALVQRHRLKVEHEARTRNRLEDEVQARTRELAERNQQLEVANLRLEEASVTDSLTGLRNRRFLFQEVTKDLALAERTKLAEERSGQRGRGDRLVFIMVDLDWFKPINDACGHAAGDRVLLQVRDILQRASRASDVLIRWGGDEFLVVGRSTDPEGLEVLPERIRSMVEQASFDLGNGQVAHLTCSIGFTCYPFHCAEVHQVSLEQVVGLADEALYVAKKGRNAWVGLLDTDRTTAEDLREVIRVDPERLVQEGKLEMRASDPGFAAAPPPRRASRVDGGTA